MSVYQETSLAIPWVVAVHPESALHTKRQIPVLVLVLRLSQRFQAQLVNRIVSSEMSCSVQHQPGKHCPLKLLHTSHELQPLAFAQRQANHK